MKRDLLPLLTLPCLLLQPTQDITGMDASFVRILMDNKATALKAQTTQNDQEIDMCGLGTTWRQQDLPVTLACVRCGSEQLQVL